jgi:hypothetical protein
LNGLQFRRKSGYHPACVSVDQFLHEYLAFDGKWA